MRKAGKLLPCLRNTPNFNVTQFTRQLQNEASELIQTDSVETGQDLQPPSFWSQHILKDVEYSTPDKELARRHNASLPYRKDQLIVGRIVRVDRNHVAVYTGHRTLNAFAKKELHLSQLVRSSDVGNRNGPRDFRIGDVLHFVLEDLETPFGDMSLRVNKVPEKGRFSVVWKEIEECYAQKRPLKGRILNSVPGGYAVGIAGFIGFCPYKLSSPAISRAVGTLQEFSIQTIDLEAKKLVVSDYSLQRRKDEDNAQQLARQNARIARFERSLSAAEDVILLKTNNRQPVGPNLGEEHFQALLDLIAIWKVKHRINAKNDDAVMPMELQNLQREVAYGRTTSLSYQNILKLANRLRKTSAADLHHQITSRLQSWGFDVEKWRKDTNSSETN